MKKPISAPLARFFMNIAPCIRASGGKVVELSRDFRRLKVRLRLTCAASRPTNIRSLHYCQARLSSRPVVGHTGATS
jgi:hypothetical protein